MVEDAQESIGVAYNLSLLQIQEVFRLLAKSNDQYLKCDFLNMVHTLRCCKLSVIQNLTQEERDKLKQMEGSMSLAIQKEQFLTNWRNYNVGYKGSKENIAKYEYYTKKVKENLGSYAEKYKEVFMDILEKHGYLIKKMEDYTKMFD